MRHLLEIDDLTSADLEEIPEEKLLAGHDRSDGGLAVTLLEMAFSGDVGIAVDVPANGGDAMSALFNEEAGVVLQVASSDAAKSTQLLAARVPPSPHDLVTSHVSRSRRVVSFRVFSSVFSGSRALEYRDYILRSFCALPWRTFFFLNTTIGCRA